MADSSPGNQEQDYISDEQVFEAMKTGNFDLVNRWYKDQIAFTKPFGAEALIDLDIKMARFQIDAHLPDFARGTLDSLAKKGTTMTEEQETQVRELNEKLDPEHVTIEIPDDQISDAEAKDSLASGDNELYATWLAQQEKAIEDRPPDTIPKYQLQIRIALAHEHASRTAVGLNRDSHFKHALRILDETYALVAGELGAPPKPDMTAQERKDYKMHIAELEDIKRNIIFLQTEFNRK